MKITIFNHDGSIKEVREQYFKVPGYITSFDEKCSFLNITEIDLAIVTQRKKSFEKRVKLDEMKFLVKQDYANYLKKDREAEDTVKIIKNILNHTYEGHSDLQSQDIILSRVLNQYSHPYNFNYIYVLERFISSGKDLIILLLYHVCKQQEGRYTENTFVFRSFLNVIHKLYYAIKRCSMMNSNTNEENVVTNILHPFATLSTMGNVQSLDLFGDSQIVRLMEVLYNNENKRKDVYDVLYTIEFFSKSRTIGQMANNMTMMTLNTNMCLLSANPSNGIETIEIELAPEEMVSLRVQSNASEKQKELIKNALQEEFDKYIQINGEILKKNTGKSAVRYHKFRNESQLLSRHWLDFYYYYLNLLEESYSKQEKQHKDLDVPYIYYYLLVELCEICKRYEFSNDFLEALVLLSISKKCIGRCDLYEQMFRLNQIEIKAGLINELSYPSEGEIEQKDEIIKKDMQRLKEEILDGPYKDIATELYDKSEQPIHNSDIVERVIVFLTPLFHTKYLNNISIHDLKKTIRVILGIPAILNQLKDTNKSMGYKHFNLKMVLNIIGLLSTKKGDEYKENSDMKKADNVKTENSPKDENSAIYPILKHRIGNSLITELKYLWDLEKTSNLRKYISNYNHKLEGHYSESYSLLTKEMRKEIAKLLSK